MNQFYLGILRGLGYPVLFAALAALSAAIPGIQGLPVWLPAGILTMAVAGFEHWLANELGYNLPSNS
jgi:integral membrane sensor domain MASE1